MTHGFYAAHWRTASIEMADLDAAAGLGLENEIISMRVWLRRFLDMADSEMFDPDSKIDLEEMIQILNAHGQTAMRIAALIWRKHQLDPNTNKDNELITTILAALGDVIKEKGLQ